jgi:YHS domain-containing protein
MSTAAPARVPPKTGGQITAPRVSSVGALVERLGAEVSAARERVRSLQTKAAQAFAGQEQRFRDFVAVADRVHAILLPRLDALTKVDVFKDINQIVSPEGQGLDVRGFHGRTTTLAIPSSDECPAKVQLSFRLGHDGPVENAIMDYRLEILPIFFKFESHDQLMIPISHPNEDAIAKWIEDKLVAFTQAFFELHFHNEYQRKHLETDVVMNIRFPKANAAGKKEYEGRTYYFYTDESLLAFEKDPSQYVVATA